MIWSPLPRKNQLLLPSMLVLMATATAVFAGCTPAQMAEVAEKAAQGDLPVEIQEIERAEKEDTSPAEDEDGPSAESDKTEPAESEETQHANTQYESTSEPAQIVVGRAGDPRPDQRVKHSYHASVSYVSALASPSGIGTPYSECSYATLILDAPLAEIEVRQPVKARLGLSGKDGKSISGLGFVFVDSQGEFECSSGGSHSGLSYIDRELQPGTYKVYPTQYGPNYESSHVPRFSPDELSGGDFSFRIRTDEAIGDAPLVSIDSEKNPTVVSGLVYPGPMVHKSFFGDSTLCEDIRTFYTSTTPIATIDIDDPSYEFSYWGPEAQGFAFLRDGKVYCRRGERFVVDLDPGTYQIFPLMGRWLTDRPFDIWLLDEQRARTHDPELQLAEGGQEIVLDHEQKELIVHDPPAPTGHTVRFRCGESSNFIGNSPEFVFPVQPTMKLTFDRPTVFRIQHHSASTDMFAYHLYRADDDGECRLTRRSRARPFGHPVNSNKAIPPGTYYVRFGFEEDADWSDVTVALRARGTSWSSTSVIRDVPDELDFDERWVNQYVPLLNMRRSTEERLSRLFQKLPDSLHVYAKYDLDQHSASPTFIRDITVENPRANMEYPTKDEALIMGFDDKDRTYVITADGLKFRLLMDAVGPEPEGEPVFPSTPRNVDLDLDDAIEYGDESDKQRVATHRKRMEEATDCWYDYVDRRGGFTRRGETLYKITYRNGEIVEVSDYGSEIGDRGAEVCGLAAQERAEGRLLDDLSKDYIKRGEERLEEIGQQGEH